MHIYVDNIKVGEVVAEEATPHHVVHRLCQLDTRFNAGQDQAAEAGVGFKLQLPELKEGKHEVCLMFTSFLPPKVNVMVGHEGFLSFACHVMLSNASEKSAKADGDCARDFQPEQTYRYEAKDMCINLACHVCSCGRLW